LTSVMFPSLVTETVWPSASVIEKEYMAGFLNREMVATVILHSLFF
jgi:hypothetical protein